MCASGDIFLVKLYKIISYIEGVKTYIDDALVVSKEIFLFNIEQLSIVFSTLRDAGFKADSNMCSLGLKEIPYLGYVITWWGIKPDPNKLQGIMDLRQPTIIT